MVYRAAEEHMLTGYWLQSTSRTWFACCQRQQHRAALQSYTVAILYGQVQEEPSAQHQAVLGTIEGRKLSTPCCKRALRLLEQEPASHQGSLYTALPCGSRSVQRRSRTGTLCSAPQHMSPADVADSKGYTPVRLPSRLCNNRTVLVVLSGVLKATPHHHDAE